MMAASPIWHPGVAIVMASLAQIIPETPSVPEAPTPIRSAEPKAHWSLATRIAFRLCVVYFGLYALTTQMLAGMLSVPGFRLPTLETTLPVRTLFVWIGTNVLGIASPMPHAITGSGDKLFNWVAAFSLLLIAAIATVIWSVVARNRESHPGVERWFRLFIRVALGTTFLTYGFAKIVPLQMPTLALQRLVQPFGDFSPMGVLWYSIGAAPAYEIITGAVEVLAGALLLFPRTAVTGAMVSLMAATQIFILNMTYDVPVKLFAFHLILISLFLLARNLPRLFDLFLRFRSSAIQAEPTLGGTSRARRIAVVAQGVFALYALGLGANNAAEGYKSYGGGAPRSPLFGIWDVQRTVIDGAERPLTLGDSTHIRRVLMQRPTGISLQRMNDTFRGYAAAIDTTAKTITITMPDTTKSVFTYERPTNERLILDGTWNGQGMRLELAFRDPESFVQRSRGFHFISPVPFNR
jgi:hypothetical protein